MAGRPAGPRRGGRQASTLRASMFTTSPAASSPWICGSVIHRCPGSTGTSSVVRTIMLRLRLR
ncbi:hypothetical protein DF18_06185 [Streptomyces rimosus]|nr:hypothetical protein DF18_06185 [Streptomyces rimosus]